MSHFCSTYLHFRKTCLCFIRYLFFGIIVMVYMEHSVLLTFFPHFEKVKLMVNPFAYEEYRKDKIRQKIEETRAQRVQLKVIIVLTTEFTREKYRIFITIPKKLAIHFLIFLFLVYIFYYYFGVFYLS